MINDNLITVSIIIPCFNVGEFLKKNIQEILSSELPNINLEIIAIDDGSTDNSILLLNELSKEDNRLRIFINKNTMGPNYSRNIGIENAKGSHILFLDGDDELELHNFGKIMSNLCYLNESPVSVFGINFVNDKNKIVRKFRFTEKVVYNSDVIDLFVSGYIPTVCWNKIYSREFLMSNGIRFIEDRVHGRDALFTLTCILNSSSITFSKEVLVNSLIRSNSFSRAYSVLNVESALTIVEDSLKLCNSKNINNKQFSLFAVRYIRYTLILALFRLDKKESKTAFDKIQNNRTILDMINCLPITLSFSYLTFQILWKYPCASRIVINVLRKMNIKPY